MAQNFLSGINIVGDALSIDGVSVISSARHAAFVNLTTTGDTTLGNAVTDGMTINGNTTINTTGVTNNLILTSTDTSASSAPDLVFYRNAAIADSDTSGVIEFRGRNAIGGGGANTSDITYGTIYSRMVDVSDQDSNISFGVNKGNGSGALINAVLISPLGTNNSATGAIIINPATAFTKPLYNLTVNGTSNFAGSITSGDINISNGGATASIALTPDGSHVWQFKNSGNSAIFRDGTTGDIPITMTGANTTFAGSVGLPDNGQLQLGGLSAGDLKLYHDATNSIIVNKTGDLKIMNQANDKDIIFMSDDGSGGDAAYITLDGGDVHVNIAKHTNFAATVNAASHFLFDDGAELRLGDDTDMGLFYSSGVSNIRVNTGYLAIRANDMRLVNQANDETYITAVDNGAVTIYYDNAVKLATTSAGATVTGTLTATLSGTATGLAGTPNISVGTIACGNITTTGYLRGPASFVIDPATHGNDTGTVVIAGNLQVDGTTTTINSTTVAIDDLNFSIATDAANSAAANGAGITIGGAGATLLYTHATVSWDVNKHFNVTGGKITVVPNSGAYDQIKIASNLTADTNKAAGIYTENYVGNNTSIFQYACNTGGNTVYYGSADGNYRGLTAHRFYVNASPTATSGHTEALYIAGNTNATFRGDISAGVAGYFAFASNSGNAEVAIKNNTATSSTSGTATLKFIQANTTTGGKIVSGRDSNYSDGATRDSHLKFYTATNATDTLVLTLNSNNDAAFTGGLQAVGYIEAGTYLAAGNGSEGAPSHSFASDLNTGMYRKGADTISLTCGGSDSVIVNAYGIGIGGAASAGYILEAEGTGHQRLNIRSSDNNTAGLFLQVKNSGNQTGNATLRTDSAGLFTLWTGTTSEAIAVSVAADKSATFAGNLTITNNAGGHLRLSKQINQVGLPDVPDEHVIALNPPTTTNYYGGGISWSEGSNTAASINAQDGGSGGALMLAFSTGNNTTITKALLIDNVQNSYFYGTVNSTAATAFNIATGTGKIGFANDAANYYMHYKDSTDGIVVSGYYGVSLAYRGNVKLGVGSGGISVTGTASFTGDVTVGSASTNDTVTIYGNTNNLVLRSQTSGTKTPELKFNISGTDIWSIQGANNRSGVATNTLVFDQAGTIKHYFFTDGNVTHTGMLSATYYRDIDNTAYYVDPANTGTSLNVAGNITHTGLTPTAGTDIDQIYTASVSLQVTTSWQDTTVNAAELATGTYIVQLYTDDHGTNSIGHYTEYYSGIMSWYSTNTNATGTDEIILHRAGHAANHGDVFLRTERTLSADASDMNLQIKTSNNASGSATYVFKFRRMI